MKIVIITNYWKGDAGGIKTYLVNLVEAMREKEINVCVFYREGDDPEEFCGGRNKLLFSINCFQQLLKNHPEVIHSQGTWYCLLPGVLYKKLHGCTLVHTFHSDPHKSLVFPGRIFFQALLSNCDCVTFVAKRLQERIVEVEGLSFSKTAITYAGVQTGEVLEGEIERFREQYGISENAVVLLAQAMTTYSLKAEGLKLLLQTLKILRKTYPNIVLIATREGKYSEEVKAFSRKMGVEEHVIFTGNVENPFVPLTLCDIYTHISLGDGLPLALLEAMSIGKPIVATPVGGIPEVIDNRRSALLVEPNVDEVAQAIDTLLNDEKLRITLGHNACTDSKEYTWEKCANKFIEIFRNDRSQ